MTRLVEGAVWFGVLFGLYVVLISSVTSLELVTGAVAAALGAGIAVLGRAAEGAAWRLPAAGRRWLLRLPAQMVLDTGRLARTVARDLAGERPRGSFRELPLPVDDEEARRAGRRALATLTLAATPATYVVDDDPGRTGLLVHGLGPAGALEKQVGE